MSTYREWDPDLPIYEVTSCGVTLEWEPVYSFAEKAFNKSNSPDCILWEIIGDRKRPIKRKRCK